MEVRSENTALMNRATAIDSYGADGKEKRHAWKVNQDAAGREVELEDQPVKISISAAGIRRSQLLEKQSESSLFSGTEELEGMIRKMGGLSSQVINGHFSTSDRLHFNSEIGKLSYELDRLHGDEITVTKDECVYLSQKIADLTRAISNAAVYRNSARTIFMVNAKQSEELSNTKLNIAI